MVKITSKSWVEKDDPMFTERFTVHSVKKKESRQNKNKKDILKTINNKNHSENINDLY